MHVHYTLLHFVNFGLRLYEHAFSVNSLEWYLTQVIIIIVPI